MTGYGDGDPSIPRAAELAHEAARARGEAAYVDPESGLLVMTADELLRRGACCGMGCRHCPYPSPAQRAAGRVVVRPE